MADVLFCSAALDGAAAFAFAGVFPFAALVTGLAAALAFTGVLSFAGMCALFPHRLERDSGLRGCAGCIGANRERPGHEPGHRGAREECSGFHGIVLSLIALLLTVARLTQLLIRVRDAVLYSRAGDDFSTPLFGRSSRVGSASAFRQGTKISASELTALRPRRNGRRVSIKPVHRHRKSRARRCIQSNGHRGRSDGL